MTQTPYLPTLVSTLTRGPFDIQNDRLFDEAIRSLGGWASP
jgi:hypothetical protein